MTYAQNGEDIVLWRALGDIAGGTYVDIGAADPVIDSVTRAFYERGWSGLNVEPVPAFAEALAHDRPRDTTVRVCAGAEPGRTVLHLVPGTGLSTQIDDQLDAIRDRRLEIVDVDAEVRRLDVILSDAGFTGRPIHFLKIDVEGMEESVLRGVDLTVWRPWVVVVEATRPNTSEPAFESWEPILTGSGYQFCLFDGLNRFYVSEEHPELVPALSYPACVFDEPLRRGLDVLAENEALNGRVAHLDGLVADLTARHDDAHARIGELEIRLAAEHAARLRLDAEATASARDAATWRRDLIRTRATLEAVTRQQRDELERRVSELVHERAGLLERIHAHEVQEHNLESLIDAMGKSVSWRVTRPLRGVRRLTRGSLPRRSRAAGRHESTAAPDTPAGVGGAVAEPVATTAIDPADADRRADAAPASADVSRFCGRVAATARVLDDVDSIVDDVGAALLVFERAVGAAGLAPATSAWLGFVAATGSYPNGGELDATTRVLRRDGPRGLTKRMEELFFERLAAGRQMPDVEVVERLVLIDVTHTAMYDLHTGIQRVVRECASRWLTRPGTAVVHWNHADASLKLLADDERRRLVNWHDHMYAPGELIKARMPEEGTGATLIPWQCDFVLPELVDTPPRCAGYASMIRSGVVRRFGMIGYDLIPMTATETVTDGMTAAFAHYLSLVKFATHLSAISHAAADEFRAFGATLRSQGLAGPVVTAAPLPTSPIDVDEEQLQRVREEFQLGSSPLVLVVGSHEPRKNHLVLLEAAETLWRRGRRFELLLVGGASWGRSEFDSYVDMLAGSGYPVRVHTRISEVALWSLYHLARFSIFTSLIEGYGLPVAESLSCGTPAITTNYGSMAEIAAGGGALEVDPRDPDALAEAMERLLTDDQLVADLHEAAVRRTWPKWEDHASAVWSELVEAPAVASTPPVRITRAST